MTDSLKEQTPAVPFSLEEIKQLSELQDRYLTELGIVHTNAFTQRLGSNVTESEAWKIFQQRYDPNRQGAAPFDHLASQKHQQIYQKAGFSIKDGDIDCQWHEDPPPGFQGLRHTRLPSTWQIKWAEGQDDWVILRISARDADGSLILREVIGKKK